MLIELLLAILIGILAGTFTGLVPGIHVNLLSAVLLSLAPVLLLVTGPLSLIVFIVSMATTHTFLCVIPSIYLGAPESSTALGVLPGHRYLLQGNGLMAVKLTIIGGLGALILAAVMFYPLIFAVGFVYSYVVKVMGWLLLLVAILNVLRDRKKGWAAIIFCLSGLLGYAVLNNPLLHNPLFPLLSGLFGTATLLVSLNDSTSIPVQKDLPYTDIRVGHTVQAVGSGSLSGLVTSVLPGIGSATAAVMSMQITPKIGDHGFMVLMGGIGTANFVFSLVALDAISKARNGALVAVSSLVGVPGREVIVALLCSALIAGGLAAALTLVLGRKCSKVLGMIPYQKLLISIISLIVVLSFVLSGWRGLIVLVIATATGLLPAIKKTSRTMGMGCILVPVMTYFLF